MIRVKKGPGDFTTQKAWSQATDEWNSEVHTPIVWEGHLFAVGKKKRGLFTCVGLAGKQVWTSEGKASRGSSPASPPTESRCGRARGRPRGSACRGPRHSGPRSRPARAGMVSAPGCRGPAAGPVRVLLVHRREVVLELGPHTCHPPGIAEEVLVAEIEPAVRAGGPGQRGTASARDRTPARDASSAASADPAVTALAPIARASSTVLLPEPFSPARNVTGASNRSRSSSRTTGTSNGKPGTERDRVRRASARWIRTGLPRP